MAIIVRFEDWHDAVHIIQCLLSVADTREPHQAILAKRLTRIAYDLSDAIDACPVRDASAPTEPAALYRTTQKAVDQAGHL